MKKNAIDEQMLRAFDALMRERHVTRAADLLELSQPSMSALLAKLRAAFDDELLVRSGTTWSATEVALSIWPRVQAAIEALDRVNEPTDFDPKTASFTFRVIAIDYIDMILIPIIMKRLREHAPDIALHVLQTNPHHFGEMMSAGELDLTLSYYPDPPNYLLSRRLFSDRFLGLAAQTNPVHEKPLDAREFCALPHITIEPQGTQIYNVQIDTALEPFNCRRRIQMVKPTFLSVPFVLETSDLVTCVPARLARRMERMAAVKAFDVPIELPRFDVCMLWHPRTQNSPPHKWFRELIFDCVHQHL
ncbi:MAG: LysR family transcriptional regulator [Acidovorax sp.]|uniref:LysR family transcriptional regulator n=1 Tax=Acidovorax sp. TaxID=1872122 RepID=UPI0039E3CCF7